MTALAERLDSSVAVRAVREALRAHPEPLWLVGGTIRDAVLGRELTDIDLAVAGDPEAPARAVARACGGPAFPLSEAFGSWRALDRERRFCCDVSTLRGEDLAADLAGRDFTANAVAVPLEGGDPVDPLGGIADLERGVLRVASARAYAEDPLRPLRLVRIAAETGLVPEPETERLTAAAAADVSRASPERVFVELRRVVCSDRVVEALERASRLGLVSAVVPELEALRGVEQSHFHHLDVHGHTLEVLRETMALVKHPETRFGGSAPALAAVLAEPLADGLTRGEALRFAALFHDVAKPATRAVLGSGRVAFAGHDAAGEEVVGEVFRRLRTSERLRSFVGAITRHHLRLGFLVHERPLRRETVYRYLAACSPVEVEVTLFSVADRLATRGKSAERSIAAHLELAEELMVEALEWRAHGPPAVPVRGDELAGALGLEPGPEIGELLARLREARFAGEVQSPEEAVAYARRVRENPRS